MNRCRNKHCCGRHRKKQSGSALLFIVIVIAILAYNFQSLIPKGNSGYSLRKFKVIDELDELAIAHANYYFDKKAWPSSISDSNLLSKFLNPGIGSDVAASRSAISDDFGKTTTNSTFSWTNNTTYITMTSLGATNASDISRSVYYELAAAARTRRILDVGYAAYTYKRATFGLALTGTWYRVDRTTFGLGPEFDTDGWGTSIAESGVAYSYSYGPNKVNNSGAGDDIRW